MKSLDETFDAIVCRPIGKRIAGWLLHTPITANQVTGSSAIVGIIPGVLIALPWPGPLAGGLLFFTLMVLDCVDGELARARGGGSWRGRCLDGLADTVGTVSLHLGLWVHLSIAHVELQGYALHTSLLFTLFAAAGASFAWNSAVVDDIKQRLKQDTVDDNLEQFRSEAVSLWDRFLYTFLVRYVAWIRRAGGTVRVSDYGLFRRAQWVGPTHHHLALVISTLLMGIWPLAPMVYAIVTVIPANLYLLSVLWVAQRKSQATHQLST